MCETNHGLKPTVKMRDQRQVETYTVDARPIAF